MRLGLSLGYSGAKIEVPLSLVQLADHLGYHSVWAAESYGSDAVTPLAWLAPQTRNIRLGTAIMQMPGRTPANTAMTATTLDQLSGGRFLLGLGLSGPQVVEGWHGQAYGKPLVRTREYVAIVREVFRRESPLRFSGQEYHIPYEGADATGLGKPLKSIIHGRPDLPIYLAAIGYKNVQLAAEIADGWLPIFFSPTRYAETYQATVENGFSAAGEKSYANFDIAPTVAVVLDDNLESAHATVKPSLALYIGGMGARGKNFYFDLACRYGYEEAATKIQDLYLAGQRIEAVMAVPDALVDEVALCGPAERIKERFALWKEAPINTLIIASQDEATIRLMASLAL
jgi:F420-dependent oxidoreductase-like protein